MARCVSRRYKLFKMLFEECRIEAKANGSDTFFWLACAIACLALASSITGLSEKELLQ
jgi:hypothetical protein